MAKLDGHPLIPWRFLVTEPASGSWNMAVDEALTPVPGQESEFQPFFRLYGWNPSCLSLGRFQNPQSGLSAGALDSLPAVRRTTGGGAILHGGEITYSLGFRMDQWGPVGVKSSYEKICSFLLESWKSLGWEACFAKDLPALPGETLGTVTAACFAGKEAYDIVVGGRKLGGNAQRRDRDFVFQHGSIPLVLDWPTMRSVFQPEALPDPGLVTDLQSLGYNGTPQALQSLLATHFESALGVELTPQALTEEQTLRARNLEQTRYLNPVWTRHGSGSLRSSLP